MLNLLLAAPVSVGNAIGQHGLRANVFKRRKGRFDESIALRAGRQNEHAGIGAKLPGPLRQRRGPAFGD